jgi:hypothetical protein
MIINAEVEGHGTFVLRFGSTLTLDGCVGRHQSFDIGSGARLNINHPHSFCGHVNVVNFGAPGNFEVNLAGLSATSYGYSNNVLVLFNGQHVAYCLRFADPATFGVFKTPSGVSISDDLSLPNPLPVHV